MNIPNELIVSLVTFVVSEVGVMGESALREGWLVLRKQWRTPEATERSTISSMLATKLVTDSGKNEVIGPIITVIHAELNHNEIRTMRSNAVVHTLKSLPCRVAVYTGILNYEGHVLLDFASSTAKLKAHVL